MSPSVSALQAQAPPDRCEHGCQRHAHLADVTHELRTPLTAIRGALDLIGSGALGPLAEPIARMLAVARVNSDRLLRLIDDVLVVEERAAGRHPLSTETVDLALLLDDVIANNTGLFVERDRGVHTGHFVLTETQPCALVRADRGRLLQVLANLISNAVKFSPPATSVMLALRRIDTAYRITVTDRGPGIPHAFRPFIFQRFARAPDTAAHIRGSGLGLHIAHAIISQHGGRIHFECPAYDHGEIVPVDRNLGGTSFHIDLPMIAPVPDSSKI